MGFETFEWRLSNFKQGTLCFGLLCHILKRRKWPYCLENQKVRGENFKSFSGTLCFWNFWSTQKSQISTGRCSSALRRSCGSVLRPKAPQPLDGESQPPHSPDLLACGHFFIKIFERYCHRDADHTVTELKSKMTQAVTGIDVNSIMRLQKKEKRLRILLREGSGNPKLLHDRKGSAFTGSPIPHWASETIKN